MAHLNRWDINHRIAEASVNDQNFRRNLISNPTATLRNEIDLPKGMKVAVVEDTADTIHFVLPYQAPEGEALSDEDLESVAGGFGITLVLGDFNCEGSLVSQMNV